jgi:ATP-dependent Clp protease protease subunit
MWIKVTSTSSFQYLSQYLTHYMHYGPCELRGLNVLLFCAQAKELDTNTDYYLELLSKGVGKPKEELAEFLKGPRYFRAQEAIDYGLADTILHSLDGSFKPKDLTAQLAKAQEMRQSGKRPAAGAGRWSTPSVPR